MGIKINEAASSTQEEEREIIKYCGTWILYFVTFDIVNIHQGTLSIKRYRIPQLHCFFIIEAGVQL